MPNPGVMANLTRYEGESALPAPVWHELRYGWMGLPEGRRKDAIGQFVVQVAGSLPVLAYDSSAARIHAEMRSERERAGKPLPYVDGQIAAIAFSHGMSLVSHNAKGFADLPGLRWVDWFSLATG